MRRQLLLGSACAALLAVPAIASAHDGNHDGLPDGWERHHKLSLKHDQGNRDQDHDGLSNKQEHRFGFNPRSRDSDSDGTADREENAGTVASFTGGVLTVKLVDGSTITGKVTDGTRIKCKTAAPATTPAAGATARHSGENENEGDDDSPGAHGNQGEDDEADDDQGDDDAPGVQEHRGDHGVNCGTAALTVGKVVHEADLTARSTGAEFKEVDLVA